MGTVSSRTLLFKSPESRKSEIDHRRNIAAITPSYRLVRNELCKEVQHSLFKSRTKARDRLPFVQVASKSVQQEDVRPFLSMEKNHLS